MSGKVNLRIGKMIKERGFGARELADRSGIAYNTALTYQRDAGDRISKDVLENIAGALGVEVYELFLDDNNAASIVAIARKLGIETENRSFSNILSDINERVSA